jgi:hypothetical protein
MTEAQQAFWEWFRANEQTMFELGDAQDGRFDEPADRLRMVDEDLTFELGPKREDKRELIVSAGGIKRAFPAVLELVAVAQVGACSFSGTPETGGFLQEIKERALE